MLSGLFKLSTCPIEFLPSVYLETSLDIRYTKEFFYQKLNKFGGKFQILCFTISSSEGSTVEVSTEEEHSNIQPRSNELQEVDEINNVLQPISTTEVDHEADEETAEEIENIISSESEAPISERAASGFSESPPIGSPRVQFENIKEEEVPCAQTPETQVDAAPSGHEEDRKCRRHQKHEHK